MVHPFECGSMDHDLTPVKGFDKAGVIADIPEEEPEGRSLIPSGYLGLFLFVPAQDHEPAGLEFRWPRQHRVEPRGAKRPRAPRDQD